MSRSSRKRQIFSMRGSGSALNDMVFRTGGNARRVIAGGCRLDVVYIVERVRLCEGQLDATPAQGILLGISSNNFKTVMNGVTFVYIYLVLFI